MTPTLAELAGQQLGVAGSGSLRCGAGTVRDRAAAGDADVSGRSRIDELNALLLNTSTGCTASFERLYDLTVGAIFAVILRTNRERAETEELCQELYLKVWLKAAQFDATKANALTWLTAMAQNLAVSSLRARHARPQKLLRYEEDDGSFEDFQGHAPGPFDIVSGRQLKQATDAALAGLPGNQRQCMNLALLDEMSHRELAAHMQRPLGTVKSWIRRCSANLREPLRSCL